MRARARTRSDTIVGRVKPADPFELIRWLAPSQPDMGCGRRRPLLGDLGAAELAAATFGDCTSAGCCACRGSQRE